MKPAIDLTEKSFWEVVEDLREDLKRLVSKEITLLKTELSQKASALGKSGTELVAGGIVAYLGVTFLMASLCALLMWGLHSLGLSAWVSVWLSLLVFGLTLGGIGFVLIANGKKSLAKISFTPEKTLITLKEVTETDRLTVAAPQTSSPADDKAKTIKHQVEKTIDQVHTKAAEVQFRLRPNYIFNVLKGEIKKRPISSVSVAASSLGLGVLIFRLRRAHAPR